VANLALRLERGERADRLLDRDLGIDRVELIEVDAVDLQPLERCLTAVLEPGSTENLPVLSGAES
jgi:hypothetical protein